MFDIDNEAKLTVVEFIIGVSLILVLLVFFIDVHLMKNDLHRIANSIEKMTNNPTN